MKNHSAVLGVRITCSHQKKMKYAILTTFLFLVNTNCIVECKSGFIKRIFNPQPSVESGEASLVLAVQETGNNCVIANFSTLITKKYPDFDQYLFACPADTIEELKINEESSKTKNALFIKESYGYTNLEDGKKKKKSDEDKKNKSDKINLDEKLIYESIEYDCEYPVRPSVVRIGTEKADKIKIDIYLVGYEVYIKEEYRKLNVIDYTGYLDLKKNFKWFNVITIRIDRNNGNVLSANSEVFSDKSTFLAPKFTNPENQFKARSNELGREIFFEKLRIDKIYNLDRQESIFDHLFKDYPLKDIYFNVKQNRYLVETYLAPLDGFTSSVLQQAALTYGNIAPMWKIIKQNSWSLVENHVDHLVQALFGVFVVTGTYGTLTISGKKIHLGPSKKVRVPLAFWKIVTYTRTSKEYHHMLIVTINNPYEDTPNDLCAKSQCADYGWDYIEQDFHPVGRTLCCEITEDIINKLHLVGFISVDRVLNLKALPHWENEELTLNVTQFIEDRKNDPTFDPHLRADDVKYRNRKDIVLENDKKDNKKNEDGKSNVKSFPGTLLSDYAVPGFNWIVTKAKNYVGSKMAIKGGQKSDDDDTLLDDQNVNEEQKGSPSDDQNAGDVEMADPAKDDKGVGEIEKPVFNDQGDEIKSDLKGTETVLLNQKDEVKGKKRALSDSEDEHPAKGAKLQIQ